MIFGILAGLIVLAAVGGGVMLIRRGRAPSTLREQQRGAPPVAIDRAVHGRAPVDGDQASRAIAAPERPRTEPSARHADGAGQRSASGAQAPATAIAGAPTRPAPATATQAPMVLIVDDSAVVRRTLVSTFGKAGYRTVGVDSGEAAIAWVREHGLPPLVTLDMEMPGMNGLDTLRALHELRSERPVQAMFVTSKNHERVRGIAEPLGAIAFFSKPYADDALLAAAQRAAPLAAAV